MPRKSTKEDTPAARPKRQYRRKGTQDEATAAAAPAPAPDPSGQKPLWDHAVPMVMFVLHHPENRSSIAVLEMRGGRFRLPSCRLPVDAGVANAANLSALWFKKTKTRVTNLKPVATFLDPTADLRVQTLSKATGATLPAALADIPVSASHGYPCFVVTGDIVALPQGTDWRWMTVNEIRVAVDPAMSIVVHGGDVAAKLYQYVFISQSYDSNTCIVDMREARRLLALMQG